MVACIDIVRREIDDLKPSELDDLLEEMRRRQRHYIGQGMDAQQAAQKASQSVSNDLKLAAAIERRNAAINLRVRREMLDFVRTQFSDNPAEGLTALLAGSNKQGFGTRMSADAVQTALKGQYVGGLIGDLERAGLFELFADGEIDLDVARALWSIDAPEELAKLPKHAVAVAKIVHRWQEKARVDANRAGAWIGKVEGYIVRQGHDADRLMRAGFDKWRDAILPRLDLNKVFPDGPPDAAGLERWLKEAWTGIVTGIHESRPANADKMAGFKGPGNLAKKLSQERKLHFKSADDWFEYNREFGPGNLREAALMGLAKQADATGLMRVLGTNPEVNLQTVYEAIRQELRNTGNFELLKGLERWGNPQQGWGRAIYQEISGRSSAPAGRMLATAGSIVRGYNLTTTLGGAVLSATTDIPVRAMEMRYQGQSFLGAIADGFLAPFQRLLTGAGAAERKALLAELGQFSEGVSGLLGARFSAQDGVTGGMAKMQRLFFKANLLTPWTDVLRDSAILATSGHLASFAGKAFAELPEATTRLLGLYGIDEAGWKVLSRATRELEDRTFFSPEAVRELSPRALAQLASERVNQVKAGVAERVQKRLAQDEREQAWVQKRAGKLREQLAGATKKLEERTAKAEGKSAEAIQALQAKLGKLDESIEFATSYWQHPDGPDVPGIERGRTVGFYGKRFLRDLGIKEGKALEAMKKLRADTRAIERDLARLQKDLNEDFIARWAERQEDLEAFADGVQQRIQERSDMNARDLGDLEPRITRILEDAREDLAVKLQTLLTDRMNYAVISPDARSRAVTTAGTQRGTAAGEITRAVMQFKSFGVAFTQRALGREAFGYGARRLSDIRSREIRGIAQLIVSTTAFGYLAMTAKDLVKGRSPRPVDDWKTLAAAMQQGGGFGIYGDFLFGEASRFGSSPLATLSGPTVGKVEDIWNLIQSAKQGEDPSAKAFRFLINNTPFINLFYTRMALDYAIFYQIQEYMNPGYLRRMEKRIEEETGQEYLLRPSEAAR
jgi:hypothetical protein